MIVINWIKIIEKMEKNQEHIESGEKITRKQAIKKVGVTALAASSLLLLNTNAASAASVCQPRWRHNGGGHDGGGHHGGRP